MGPMSGGPKRKRPAGLLDMAMSGMPMAPKPAAMMMKPPVDMAGRRAAVRKRPKKVKVRPTMGSHAMMKKNTL